MRRFVSWRWIWGRPWWRGEDRGKELRERISHWQVHWEPPDPGTEGRRHQLLLRELIDALDEGRPDDLNADEAAFLCAVHRLSSGMRDLDAFQRLRERLNRPMGALSKRVAEEGTAPGLPGLWRRMGYVTERELRGAPHRESRLLAGIELPCRGAVYETAANLRVLGDVPDNCTVVTEGNATCCVEGYVLGRVLAKRQCEVRGNVSGVVIVLREDVRARSIINNATAIAKMGSVYCRNAQGPRLVFGGKEIHIAEGVILGQYITRSMVVGNEVRGGQIQVSQRVESKGFRHLGASNLAIVLRRELCCEDFGEVTGEELNQLLSEAYRLRRLAHNYDSMESLARRECEHQAQSALMYIFGGSETHKKLEDIAAARRRLTTLERTANNLQLVLEAAEDRLARRGGGEHFMGEDALLSFEEVASDDQDLAQENEEAKKFQQKLRSRSLSRTQAANIVSDVKKRLSRLDDERESLDELVVQRSREMQSLDQYDRLLGKSGKSATKLELLKNILPSLKQQPADSPSGVRLASQFVQMALRNVDRQLRHASENASLATKYRNEFHAVTERLGKDFQIRVLENPAEEEAARAVGRFDGGVRIYLDVFADNPAELPEGSVILTPEGDNEVRTYVRPVKLRGFHSHLTR